MKILKFLFAIMLAVLVQGINAQVTGFTNSLDYSQTFVYEVDVDNVFSTGDSIYEYSVFKKSDSYLRPTLYLELDSISGVFDTVMIYLESKEWDEQDYTIRDSAEWTSGVDTTKEIIITTAVINALWQTRLVGENDEFRFNIDLLKLRFYK